MRVAFAGTPAFAATALDAIVEAGHAIPLVLTQPDRPAGRGMRMRPSPVAEASARRALQIAKPATLREPAALALLAAADADVLVVAAYGLLLPPEALAIPRRGCLNIHASLLPRWRGAAPIQRAILAGDRETGISIMQMEAGLDTGPVLMARPIPIGAEDNTATLTHRLAALGADAIVAALATLSTLEAQPQDPALATYAPKVGRSEAAIDWHDAAEVIDRRIRAFNPYPGAEARIGSEVLKIWSARPVSMSGAPGEIVACDERVVIACGTGALQIERVQRPGGKVVAAAEFARGARLAKGGFLGAADSALR